LAVQVPVKPAILQWAQVSSGKTPDLFEQKFSKWTEWVSTSAEPTINQVHEIAKFANIPFGMMFLEIPPTAKVPIPDFRVGIGGSIQQPSQELLDSIYASQLRQDWFRDYATRNGLEPSGIVGKGRRMSVANAGEFTRTLFDFEPTKRPRNLEGARNLVRKRFEELGGLVVFAGVIGNNIRRALDPQEFRGFTLADDIAPLIFVNAKDSFSGQLFTFFHEFAHVLRAETGLGNDDPSNPDLNDAEKWCNAVAAEVLVPEHDLRRVFHGSEINVETLEALNRRYLASTLTILLRLRDLKLIPRANFDSIYNGEAERIAVILSERSNDQSGGNHWYNQPFRVGERLARAVISDARSGHTPYTEAFRLLAVKNTTGLDKLAEQVGLQ
jgi:Zn-dependent peptidase ImmA (M78 family)